MPFNREEKELSIGMRHLGVLRVGVFPRICGAESYPIFFHVLGRGDRHGGRTGVGCIPFDRKFYALSDDI